MGLVSQRNALKTGTYVRRLVITLFIANWQPHNSAITFNTKTHHALLLNGERFL